MKRLLLLISLLPGFAVLSAQSLETGKQHYYYERFTSAENSFHSYLSQHADDAEAWCWLTKTYIVENKTDKAGDSLALAPAGIKEEPYYMVARGMVLLQNGKTDSAQLYFTNAIDETKGKNSGILSAIAEAQIISDNGNKNYAIELAQKALKRDKHNAMLYVLIGDANIKMHKGSEAFAAYRQAIDGDKNLAAAYYKSGDIFVSQKNSDVYVDYFNKAVNADKAYGPAYYALYNHYLYKDPAKAMQYFNQYVALADKDLQQDYSYTDLLYLNKNYQNAIDNATKLLQSQGDSIKPRIYKLIAYSYAGLTDTSKAMNYMKQYFQNEVDSNLLVKDFETMGALFVAQGNPDSAMTYYERATGATSDSTLLYAYYNTLANLAKSTKDYASEAKWLGKFYVGNEEATNVHLFNWGLASFRAKDYVQADTVFGRYIAKYPEQGFGYYWRARSNAAIDTAMTEGLAIPHYQKLVEVVNEDSAVSSSDKKWLIEAYSYLAAYETNTQKDYAEAIGYFNKLLEVDPENANAKKYIEMLEKNLEIQQAKQNAEEDENAGEANAGSNTKTPTTAESADK